jgi:hypothetical protein
MARESPLLSFIMSRIVCISPTLYGAVESLEVNESISRQLIKLWEKRTNHQYCYSAELQLALQLHQQGTCAPYNRQDIVTSVPFKWCVDIVNIDVGFRY